MDPEVDTDGRDEGGRPCVITETEGQTRPSDTWNSGLSRRQLCAQIQKHLNLRSKTAGECDGYTSPRELESGLSRAELKK